MSDFVHTIKCRVDDDPKSKWGRRLYFFDEQAFRWMLMRFTPGTEVLIGIKKYFAKHSAPQRGYLHGVVIKTIADHIGEDDPKVVYLWAKTKFNPKVIVGKDGESEEPMGSSLKEADTKEMTEFIDKLIRWAQDFLGLTIPPPDRTMVGGQGI